MLELLQFPHPLRVERLPRPAFVLFAHRLQAGETAGHGLPHGLVARLRRGLFELADGDVRQEPDLAIVRLVLAAYEPQQGRLARPVPADQTDALASVDGEVCLAQDDLLAEAERYLVEADNRHRITVRRTGRTRRGPDFGQFPPPIQSGSVGREVGL